jgi:large subunit ribosomal protein L23
MALLNTIKKDLSSVLKKPRITEKGAVISGTNNVYPFNVRIDATKKDIKEAVKLIYKVNPVKIAVVTIPAKSVRSRRTGKIGTKSGGKKAYVYLKKGDKIEFV